MTTIKDFDSLETEKKILEAAKIVFIRKGMAETKMQDIADEAKISRTALNYYYRTKENLFKPILEHFFLNFFPQEPKLDDPNIAFIEKIDILIDWYVSMLLENELLAPFIIIEFQRNAKQIAIIVKENIFQFMKGASLLQQMEKEMDEGKLKRMDFESVLISVYGLIIFPFLIKPIMMEFGFEDKKKFKAYVLNYKQYIHETTHQLLKP